jgi:uncharacterized iron-regulated membrane protein
MIHPSPLVVKILKSWEAQEVFTSEAQDVELALLEIASWIRENYPTYQGVSVLLEEEANK